MFKKNTSTFFLKNFILFLIIFSFFAGVIIFVIYTHTKNRELTSEKERYISVVNSTASQINNLMKEMDHLSIYISENYVEVVQKIVEDDELPKNYEHGFLMPYSIPIGKENQRFSIVTKNGNFQSFGYPVSLKKFKKNLKQEYMKSCTILPLSRT